MEGLAALQVLAEPRRLAILDLLRNGERPVGELVEQLRLSQPAVSKHLRVLKDAGLVEARPDAQRRLYRIRPEPLAELDQWLAAYRELWTTPGFRQPSRADDVYGGVDLVWDLDDVLPGRRCDVTSRVSPESDASRMLGADPGAPEGVV